MEHWMVLTIRQGREETGQNNLRVFISIITSDGLLKRCTSQAMEVRECQAAAVPFSSLLPSDRDRKAITVRASSVYTHTDSVMLVRSSNAASAMSILPK